MFIESVKDYNKFLNENADGNCIIHVVTTDDEIHGAVNSPLALFVKNVNSGNVYIINIAHYDIGYKVPKDKVLKDLNNLYCTKFVLDKKRFSHVLPVLNLKDLQLSDFMENGVIDDSIYVTTNYMNYYNRLSKVKDINNVIPLTMHLEIFDNICKIYEDTVEVFKEDESYKKINDNIIDNLKKIESNGLFVDGQLFKHHFGDKKVEPVNNLVYTEYNVYTSTGRPSNRFGGINYSALNKENECRTSFVSRHGADGMLFLIDYSAYHPHIVAKLINYEMPQDVYGYLGQYYTGKALLSEEDRNAAKNLTFQCMYGNIPAELLNIPFFHKMNEYIKHRWEYFNENGYVETPIFKRRITNKHIIDPNPNKLFNYILQASETEFGMTVLSDINDYLCNKKTKVILYTYDSLLYDAHREDGIQTLQEIKKIMSQSGFPVKCYVGHNYDHMVVVNI